MTDNLVRKTTFWVIKRAKDVRINQEKITEIAEKWAKKNLKVPPRKEEDVLRTRDEQKTLDYLILLDTTNFCFWPPFIKVAKGIVRKEKWNTNYKGKKYKGYYALSVSWKKFFEDNSEKANLKHFSEITFADFNNIFNGRGELQFIKRRWKMIRAVSRILIRKYAGDSRKFVKSAKHKFSLLVPKIYKELPFFDDIAEYKKKKVYFLKRAQILACDICFAFNNKGIGRFGDLDYLTAMADYKLPQIFHHWGILEYSKKLKNKIENKILIPAGSEEEIEIRSATIWVVEYLKNELAKRGKKFYPYEIDWILWDMSQKEKMEKPYHLTKSIFY